MLEAGSQAHIALLKRFNAACEAVHSDHATQEAAEQAAREWNAASRASAAALDLKHGPCATQFVVRQGKKFKVRPYALKGAVVALIGGDE